MQRGGFQNYVTNVAAAISGHEGFSTSHPDAKTLYSTSIIILLVYVSFIILFSAGAASLSYHYNLMIGTSGLMTGVYSVLAFMFSSLYYPYYALALNPMGSKVQKGGRKA